MSNDHTRRRILRRIENAGPTTRAALQVALDLPFGAAVTHLTSLERYGHIRYDPTTNTYDLTTETRMRRIARKSKSPQTTGARTDNTLAPVASIEAKMDEMVQFMEGDSGLLLHILRDEPTMYERAALALSQGLTPPPLLDVPRYRRLQEVEQRLDAWESAIGGPCGFCGTIASRPGYAPRGFMDASDDTAAFAVRSDGTAACRWCNEFLIGHNEDQLRKAVFNAVVGAVGTSETFTRKGGAMAIPFAREVGGGAGSARPWAHLTQTQKEGMRVAAKQLVHSSRFVRNAAQQAQIAVPGIVPPLHPAPARPARIAPITVPSAWTTYEEQLRAVEAKHEQEQKAFLVAHPTAHGFRGEEVEWPSADEWTALLQRQRDELVAAVKKAPARADGRPTYGPPRRPGLPPARIG